nr:reverse transcriptase domain-containing protein [Tanacetum cinerariifolium]
MFRKKLEDSRSVTTLRVQNIKRKKRAPRGRRSGRSCSMSESPERTSIFSKLRRDKSESHRHIPVEFSVKKMKPIPRKRYHEGTSSWRTKLLSESEDSGGGHLKSRSKKHKSSIEEDDMSQPWVSEETDPFTLGSAILTSQKRLGRQIMLKHMTEVTIRKITSKSFKRVQRWNDGNQHRSERRHEKFTLLTKSPREILVLDKGKFKTPPPMTTLVEKINSNKICEFHVEVRRNINECMHLRRQIKELIKARKLSHVIKELKQNSKKYQPKATKKGEASGKDKPLAILMVQPWKRVARQRIIQRFSPNPEILFPPLWDEDRAEGPMIIEGEIGSHFIYRIYLDGGSASKLLYEYCFNRLRPKVKNYTNIASIGSAQKPEAQYSSITQAAKERIKVAIHPEYLDQTIVIGSTLKEEGRKALCELLRRNLDIFSWKPEDMTGNAGATYQRLVDNAFQKQIGRNLEVYVDDMVLVEELNELSINEAEVLAVMEKEGDTWMTQIYEYLKKETLLANKRQGPYDTSQDGVLQHACRNKICGSKSHIDRILLVNNACGCKKDDSGMSRLPGSPPRAKKPTTKIDSHHVPVRFASIKHPQANGLVERANKSLGEGIKARLDDRNKDWIEEIPHVLWAHHTMIKSSNGDTPFSLTYKTKAVILAVIGMPILRTAKIDMVQNDEAMEINLDLLEERREKTAIPEARSKAKMEKYYNSKVCNTSFKPEDLVYRNNDAIHTKDSGKLSSKWEGPYEVTEALGNEAYKLRDRNGKLLSRT